MLKEIMRMLKEYEIIENNGQRLKKGYKPKYYINKLWGVLYEN